jgi:outer membrane protein assembly factor BamB
MKQSKMFISAIVLLALISNIYAQDWPQYLGPGRNGVSTQKDIMRTWPQQGPEVLWTAEIGIGYGGPVIKDGKAYLLDRDDKVGDKLRCFDITSGKELWNFAYDAPGSVMFPGSRSIPTVDGNKIYTVGPYGNLYCIDLDTHKPVWNSNVWTDLVAGKFRNGLLHNAPLFTVICLYWHHRHLRQGLSRMKSSPEKSNGRRLLWAPWDMSVRLL